MAEKYEKLKFRTDIVRDIYEHEIFMSFFSDEDAEKFRDWWEDEGSTQFNEYVEKEE